MLLNWQTRSAVLESEQQFYQRLFKCPFEFGSSTGSEGQLGSAQRHPTF